MKLTKLIEAGTKKIIWVNNDHVSLIAKINQLDPKYSGPRDAQTMIFVSGSAMILSEPVEIVIAKLTGTYLSKKPTEIV